ncbi:hypothetical protein Q7P35_005461 [Cladosporium inversicolor]
MSSNKQTLSSSALVAATNQGANGRTTGAMKAKENAGNSQQADINTTADVDGILTKSAMPAKEIDRTSHLHIQRLSNGNILANSNGKPEREQDDLEKLLKAPQVKPFLWGTQIPAVSKEDMASDFEAMGYSSAAIKDLINRQEPIRVDGCSQRPCVGHGKTVAGTGISPKKPKRKAAKGQPKKKKASPAPEQTATPPKAASKKRKADEISANPAPETAREPSAAAEETVAAIESVGGEGKQRKKRRPGRPKISAERVENSGSE